MSLFIFLSIESGIVDFFDGSPTPCYITFLTNLHNMKMITVTPCALFKTIRNKLLTEMAYSSAPSPPSSIGKCNHPLNAKLTPLVGFSSMQFLSWPPSLAARKLQVPLLPSQQASVYILLHLGHHLDCTLVWYLCPCPPTQQYNLHPQPPPVQ